MTAITRDQLDTLIELQKIETEKRQVEAVLKAVEQKIGSLEKEVRTVADDIQQHREQLETLRERYREFETKAQENSVLIRKIEEKRRSVQTEKEYKLLLKEEDQLRSLKNQAEEEMINCMGRLEAIEADLKGKEAELASVSQRVTEDKQSIRQEASVSEERHAVLAGRWDEVANMAAPKLLKTFTQLKELIQTGDAVVPARAAVCCGCHMNIPAQMYNELQRSDSLKMCPFCNRILYWEKD